PLVVVVADFRQIGAFRCEGWVLGVDDDGAGNGVGALRGGLRAAEDLDAFEVPDGRRSEIELVIVQVVAIEIDGGARHRTAPEGALAGQRALAILASNDRRADAV